MTVPRNSRERVGLGFVLTLALAIFFVDRLAKCVVVGTMRLGEGVAVVPGILGFTHAKNPGGAAGILGDGASVLLLACVASLAALMWVFRSFGASSSCRGSTSWNRVRELS
jgi:lipoprotein signal peptidase